MRLSLLFFSIYLVTFTTAYGLYGGYERMFYWYAYQMDVAKNGEAQKIAKGCKPAPCNFVNFIKFIADPQITKDLPNFQGGNSPPVDATARTLNDAKLTGGYNCRKIHTSIRNSDDVATLFTEVAKFVGGARDAAGVTDAMRDGVSVSIDRVAVLRQEGNSKAFGEALEKKFPGQVKWEQRPLGPNMAETVTLCDTAATQKAIRENVPGQEKFRIRDALTEFNKNDPNHASNVQNAKEARMFAGAEC